MSKYFARDGVLEKEIWTIEDMHHVGISDFTYLRDTIVHQKYIQRMHMCLCGWCGYSFQMFLITSLPVSVFWLHFYTDNRRDSLRLLYSASRFFVTKCRRLSSSPILFLFNFLFHSALRFILSSLIYLTLVLFT